uniref:Uncharacterized protein n=1 Tax=Sphaerodactylus townsendi TaxID=933632 RepID=A0ACB8FTT7_9SAUR
MASSQVHGFSGTSSVPNSYLPLRAVSWLLTPKLTVTIISPDSEELAGMVRPEGSLSVELRWKTKVLSSAGAALASTAERVCLAGDSAMRTQCFHGCPMRASAFGRIKMPDGIMAAYPPLWPALVQVPQPMQGMDPQQSGRPHLGRSWSPLNMVPDTSLSLPGLMPEHFYLSQLPVGQHRQGQWGWRSRWEQPSYCLWGYLRHRLAQVVSVLAQACLFQPRTRPLVTLQL